MRGALSEVLLVEDEADDAELLMRALRELKPGISVTVVRDGVEALRQLLSENPDEVWTPRLIILDLNLPRLDGMQVLRCIQKDERTSGIPVVVLSGTCSPEDVGASRHYGAKACMRKPHSGGEMRRLAEVLTGELH